MVLIEFKDEEDINEFYSELDEFIETGEILSRDNPVTFEEICEYALSMGIDLDEPIEYTDYIPPKPARDLSLKFIGLRGHGYSHRFQKTFYCNPFIVIPYLCTITVNFDKYWSKWLPIYDTDGNHLKIEKTHIFVKVNQKLRINIHGLTVNIKWG